MYLYRKKAWENTRKPNKNILKLFAVHALAQSLLSDVARQLLRKLSGLSPPRASAQAGRRGLNMWSRACVCVVCVRAVLRPLP